MTYKKLKMKFSDKVMKIPTHAFMHFKNFFSSPVNIIFFKSSVKNNNVTLSWKCIAFDNFSGFDLERKQVDSSVWTMIDFIYSKSINTVSDYFYEDLSLSEAKYNYRLKLEVTEGSVYYFELTSKVIIKTASVELQT